MNNSDIIDFYYFSGTGNTLLVVKEMKKTLKQKTSPLICLK